MKREHHLSWHPNGGWCRKFPGDANRTYFGRVTDAEAVRRHGAEVDRRAKGEADKSAVPKLTAREAVNAFLNHLDGLHESGEISPGQRARYGRELVLFLDIVGKHTKLTDFCAMNAPDRLFRPLRKAAIARGLEAAHKHITQVTSFLDWCSSVRRYIPAPFYADEFNVPGAKEKRAGRKKSRRKHGASFWQPEEVRQIVEAAKQSGPHRYAQVLLMLNGGMGATDLSELEDADVDWERKCIHTDRSKTLVPRVVPLWKETLAAMRASRDTRPTPAKPEWQSRFFLTRHGQPLVVETLKEDRTKTSRTDSMKNWFYLLLNGKDRKHWKTPAVRLRKLKRHRAGGYTLRSVFATLARGHGTDANLDAVIMGQKLSRPILEGYLRGDMLAKLRHITDHVHSQIWPD